MGRPMLLLFGLYIVAAADGLEAQQPDTLMPPADTTGPLQAGPERDEAVDTLFQRRPPLSPGGAFARSLILPGWAQAELGSPGRGAFYFLMEATSLWMWFRTQARLDHADRTLPEDADLIRARKQQREDWIALAIFWAFFSAADGWISVHLWGFEEVTGERPPDQVSIDLGWKIPFAP